MQLVILLTAHRIKAPLLAASASASVGVASIGRLSLRGYHQHPSQTGCFTVLHQQRRYGSSFFSSSSSSSSLWPSTTTTTTTTDAAASPSLNMTSSTSSSTTTATTTSTVDGKKRMSITIRSPLQRTQSRHAEDTAGGDSSGGGGGGGVLPGGPPTADSTATATNTASSSNSDNDTNSSSGDGHPSQQQRQRPHRYALNARAWNHDNRNGPTPETVADHAVGLSGRSTSSSHANNHGSNSSTAARFTEPVKRIILIRNGRSEANDDVSAYVTTPDWRIPLVDAGKQECVESGRRLAELVGDEPVYIYYSPYIRSRQSLRYILQGYDEGRQLAANRREWWEGGSDNNSSGSSSNGGHGQGRSPAELAETAASLGAVDAMLSADAKRSTADSNNSTNENSSPEATIMMDPSSSLSSSSPSIHQPPHPPAPPHAATADAAPIMTPTRLRDTSLILRSGTNNRIIGVREDVRLRDGDIGRYRNTAELIHNLEERERYGRFFYRFPFGESGADVCDRVTSFLDAFQLERVEFPMDTNVVVITHGLTIRMFVKRWFHLTVDTFHKMKSPPAASIVTLTRLHHQSCFRLDEACVEGMSLPLSLNEHNGYKYRNKRLLGSMSSGAPYM